MTYTELVDALELYLRSRVEAERTADYLKARGLYLEQGDNE